MNKLLGFVLLLLVACNTSNKAETGDECSFIPEKETIEVESAAYRQASGNAVVAIVSDDKHQITNVVIRYIEVLQNGKLTRITQQINKEQQPQLAAAIDAIEESARKGKLSCGKDKKSPAQLQFLVKLSFK